MDRTDAFHEIAELIKNKKDILSETQIEALKIALTTMSAIELMGIINQGAENEKEGTAKNI